MIASVRIMLIFSAAPEHACAERKRTRKVEEDLRVGRPSVCLVGLLSWDRFGLGLTMVREAPLIFKREDGTVADDCCHMGELGFSELMLCLISVSAQGWEEWDRRIERKLHRRSSY